MLRIILTLWILAAGALADQAIDVRVFNAATGAGIPDFPLRFLQYGQTLYSGATDAAGRFRIEAAKEGPYTVLYERGKFWPAQESGLIGGSIALQVGGGADPLRLEIGMYPMSKISGRVLDAAGKPVPKARIDLQDTMRGAGMIFESDEKGEFNSEELPPGTWTLAATAPPSLAPPESPTDQPLGWVHTYYPNVASRDLAAPIIVPPGGEFKDMDIRLAAVPVHRIRGIVLDVSGNPVPKVSVTLDAHEPPALHQDSKSDGTFEIAQVVEGDCRLSTTLDKDGVKLRAAQWVHVKDRDLENVELRLIAPFAIQGKVVMEVPEGAPAPASTPKIPGVTLRSADGFGGYDAILPGIGFFDGMLDMKSGAFAIKNLYPGPYQILPGAAPAPYYLDSIRFGARDALAPDAQVLPGDLPLTITYKLNGGTVRGTVETCSGGAVLLVPQDPALRRDGFVHRAGCDKDGRFEIPAVRPGEYYGMVVAADNPAGQRRSGFPSPVELDQNLLNRSARISVRSNEATLADLHRSHGNMRIRCGARTHACSVPTHGDACSDTRYIVI